jgi:phage protein U
MLAQLGTTIFENSKTFDAFNKTGSVTFAEHSLIGSKPRLQFTGSNLDELQIEVRLHVSFCKPAAEISKLRASRDKAEVLPLLWGNGILEGNFVITTIAETIEHSSPEGDIFSYLLNISLKEYFNNNKLALQQQFNRDNAKAVGDKKRVVKKKVNAPTCPQVVSKLIASLENRAAAINKIFLEKGGPDTAEKKHSVRSNIGAMLPMCSKIISICDDVESCAHPYPNIKAISYNIRFELDPFITSLSLGFYGADTKENEIVQRRVKELKAAATPLIKKSITRNG